MNNFSSDSSNFIKTSADDSASGEQNSFAAGKIGEILESIRDCFVALDNDWRFVYFNHAAEDYFGRQRGEVLGKNIWEVFPAAKGDVFEEKYREAVVSQQTVRFETRSLVKPGGWIEVDFYPSKNGLSIYFRDVTEKKLSEEKLRESVSQLRLVTDAVPALISYLDAERRYRFVNRAYTDWFGHLAEDIIGKHVYEVIGEAAYQKVLPQIERVLAGEAFSFEQMMPYKDGGSRFIAVNYVPDTEENGTVKGYYALVRDISERKEVEANQNFLLEIAEIIRRAENAEDLLFSVTEVVGRHLQVSRSLFIEVDLDGDAGTIHRDFYAAGLPSLAGRIPPSRFSPDSIEILRGGRTLVNCDIKNNPRTAAFYETGYKPLGMEAFVGVPLLRDGRLTAMLAVVEGAARSWTKAEISLLETVAERAWLAVEKLRGEALVRESEKQLRRTKARLESALETGLAGTFYWDIPNDRVITDENLRRYFSLSDEATGAGVPLAEVLPAINAEDREQVAAALTAAIEKTSVYQIEYRVNHSDGQTRWLSARGAVERDAGGAAIGLPGFAVDITEQKRAEENIKNQKKLLEALTESVLDGILIVSPDGRMLNFNQHFLDIWNFPPEVIESQSDERALDWAANQTANPAAFLARVTDIYSQPDKHFREEMPMRDGRAYERYGAPILSDETRLGWVWTFRDITDRKRTEMNLVFLAEISEDLTRLSNDREIMRLTAEKIGSYLDVSHCIFTEYDTAQSEATVVFDWSKEPAKSSLVGTYRLADFVADDLIREIAGGKQVVLNDTAADSRTAANRERFAQLEIGATVNSPYLSDERWKASLTVHSSAAREWRRDELELLSELSARIWTRIERARAERAVRTRNRQLDLLARTSQMLITGEQRDETETLEIVFAEVADALETEFFFNFLVTEDGAETLRLATSGGLSDAQKGFFSTIRFGEYLCGTVAQRREKLIVENLQECEFAEAAALCSAGVKCYAGFPLMAHGKLLGTIAFATRSRTHFRHGELQLIQTVCDQMATTLARHRAEQAVKKSESEFRRLANAVPQIVWVAGKDGKIEYVNDIWTRFSGLDLAQTAEPETVAEAIHPEDRERVFGEWTRAFEAGESYEVEARMKEAATGEYCWFLMRSEPTKDAHENVVKWFGTSTDITANKEAEEAMRESEEKFRNLANSISQLAWIAESDGSIFWYNQRWFDYTGTTLEEMRGWGWQTVHHAEEVERVTEKFKRHIASGEIWEDTFPLKSKTGEYRWFLSRALPIRNERGEVVRWFGTNTDVEEIRQARLQAETANRLKDEFLATVSHELRTPLNSMLGWATIAKSSGMQPDKVARAFDVIERNGRQQNQIIEDILDVSRIITGKLNLQLLAVNLIEVINAAIETVRPTLDIKQIRLVTDFDAAARIVTGDANRLQQVVWNLLTNAVKFTEKGGEIAVSLCGQNEFAEITVSDTGLGIEPQFLPFVFDRFRQEDGGTNRKFGGLGLGLAIVRHITEAHGGTIGVSSEGRGRGTSFVVRLPFGGKTFQNGEKPRPPENGEFSPNAVGDVLPQLAGLRILIVDDEPDALDLASTILEQYGATIETADSAPAALRHLEKGLPDVVISDIGMPETDGFDLIREIRRRFGKKIPVIALTAYARSEDNAQALRAGFDKHLAKPLEPAALVTGVLDLTNAEKEEI